MFKKIFLIEITFWRGSYDNGDRREYKKYLDKTVTKMPPK